MNTALEMATARMGELCALSAAVCWAVCMLGFSAAGRRVGSLAVNVIRLVLAVAIISTWRGVTTGYWLPTDAGGHSWLWLSISGFLGFFIGDMFLFRAFVTIGPRLSAVLMSLAPPIAALAGLVLLGETIKPLNLLGMIVTLGGVAWVVLERTPQADGTHRKPSGRGVAMALVGAAGQGLGLVMAKIGMIDAEALALRNVGDAPVVIGPIAATQIRALVGVAAFAVVMIRMRRTRQVAAACRNRRAMGGIVLGTLTGPVIGVALLLKSVQLVPSGIAQTLAATVPVLILPLVVIFEKERVSLRAALGAVFAFVGVALLFR